MDNLCHAQYGVRMTTVDRPTSQGWVADDSTFGARLALIRQRMRWGNVKEAATACGLPAESWRSWERDGRAPQRLAEIGAIIADRTGCDYGWLVAGPRAAGGTSTVSMRYRTLADRVTSGIVGTLRETVNRPIGRRESTGPGRTARIPRKGMTAPGVGG